MLWIARTTDGVTHACTKPDAHSASDGGRNVAGFTSTACGLTIAREWAPRTSVLALAAGQRYVGLFRGLPAEVTCDRCRVSWGFLAMDDGRDERGEEIAA